LGFGQLKDAKEVEIQAAGEAITAKEKRQGDLALSLVNDKNSLDDATDENSDGTEYLATLKDQCTTKMKERDMRKKMRTDEIAAISEAVKILSDDDALDIFKKAVPSASALLAQKPIFDAMLQTQTGATAGALRLGKAKSLLAKLDKKHPSAQMDLLLLTLSGKEKELEKQEPGGTAEHFDGAAKVVDGMIDNMVHVLHDEDVEDEHKKDWCSNETEATQKLNTEKQALVDKLKADLESLHDELDQTNSDIKVMEETIAALDKSVHEATELRKKEHAEFVNTFATMDTARRLIEKAATRLEKFYHPKTHQEKKDAVSKQALDSAGLSLVTSHTAPKSLAVQRMEASFALIQRHSTHKGKVDPITITDTPKEYEKKESGGVVGLMMEMKSDLTADMTAAETEEKYSAKDYSRIMKEAQATRAADVKSLNHKESIKAELESKIADTKELQSNTLDELQNLALYMVQLDTECSFLIRNFEARHEGRVGEEVGLEDAKTIVTGGDPVNHQTVEAGFESEHSEKQVDEHFVHDDEHANEGGHHIHDEEHVHRREY
jgi:hypothetical protein